MPQASRTPTASATRSAPAEHRTADAHDRQDRWVGRVAEALGAELDALGRTSGRNRCPSSRHGRPACIAVPPIGDSPQRFCMKTISRSAMTSQTGACGCSGARCRQRPIAHVTPTSRTALHSHSWAGVTERYVSSTRVIRHMSPGASRPRIRDEAPRRTASCRKNHNSRAWCRGSGTMCSDTPLNGRIGR
jgi:hypothetical protein